MTTLEIDEAIAEQLKEGRYASREELLREALHALDEREACEGIWRGMQDFREGRTHSLEDAFADIRESLKLPQG